MRGRKGPTAVQEIQVPLPISFLVASRPEQAIRDAFNAEYLGNMFNDEHSEVTLG